MFEIDTNKQDNFLTVNFAIKWNVGFGKAVYLVGNTDYLGQWNLQNSHKMEFLNNQNWYTSIKINKSKVDQIIQYKYFCSDFDALNKNNITWQPLDKNCMLSLKKIEIDNKIQICSFNIRFLNEKDKGQNHWNYRKDKVATFLNKKKYDFIGVQQATLPQREFLNQKLQNYQYFGKARDLRKDEQCGIFVKKQAFIVLQDNYDWISETRNEGSIGYDAKLPRYFTTLLITPRIQHSTQKKLNCFLIINLHLDHMGKIAQQKGVQQVLQKAINIRERLNKDQICKLKGCLIMGDYNISQTNPSLGILKNNQTMKFKSIRQIPKADKSLTFNGFQNKYLLRVGQWVINDTLTIDHMYYWSDSQKQEGFSPYQFEVNKQEPLSDHFPIIGKFKI